MFERATYKSNGEAKHISWENVPDPIGSKKYDGGHDFLVIGQDGTPSFISRRQGVKGNYPEHQDKLPHLQGPYPEKFRGHIFSVEMIHTGKDKDQEESHPAVSGILNSLAPRAIKTQEETGPVRAVLLDVLHPALHTYRDKLRHMQELEKSYGRPDVLYTVPVAIGKDQIKDLIEDTKKKGQEGIIVTSGTLDESNNPRIKIKHLSMHNLKIVGFQQEVDKNGNFKPSVGAINVVDASGREVAKVGTGLSKDLREDMFRNPDKYLGTIIQVKSFGTKVNRLAGPVYNGEADGDIDLVSNRKQT
jgi:hypothetical protein